MFICTLSLQVEGWIIIIAGMKLHISRIISCICCGRNTCLQCLKISFGNEDDSYIEHFKHKYPKGFVANIDTKNHLSGYEVLATYLANMLRRRQYLYGE